MIATIAAQQIVSLRRQRFVSSIVAIFGAVTTMAGIIGWSSHNTIIKVYNEATRLLASEGKPAPPNPFLVKPTLSLLTNMAIYVPLIGALIALVLGHLSFADDLSSGIGRLIFSRQVSRTKYLAGKILSAGVVLAAMLAASLVISITALAMVNGSWPSASKFASLLMFYALSWLYLMAFALVGMLTVLMSRRRSLALLSAIGVWLVVTFVVPQFTSGLRPTTSLNPINDPVSTSQAFFNVTAKFRPASVGEQYKRASAQILGTAPNEAATATLLRVLPIAIVAVALVAITARIVQRNDYSRSTSNE